MRIEQSRNQEKQVLAQPERPFALASHPVGCKDQHQPPGMRVPVRGHVLDFNGFNPAPPPVSVDETLDPLRFSLSHLASREPGGRLGVVSRLEVYHPQVLAVSIGGEGHGAAEKVP
jgi:hypothetical protein